MADLCDTCMYNVYDDEDDAYCCDLRLDEDEYVRAAIRARQNKPCMYYRSDPGEYDIVRKQN